jgi:tripeptidyl-peptidase-1
MLDIEYIAAITDPIPLTVVYSSTYSLLNYVNELIEMPNPPYINSVSYGNDEVQQTSTEYMETCNTQFQLAGAMGLSILFASGDQGVWGRTGYSKTATFHPDFPAASPYVTAVGGTNFVTKSVIGAEAAWSCGGGGFSNTFSIPSYQASFVQSYLTNAAADGTLPDAKYFNSSGRAYPDVSALGGQTNPYCVSYRGGKFGGIAGTSASCPVVAGVFAQLNDLRFRNNQPAMGFLNPFIYQNGDCFNDVQTGTNNCNADTPGFTAIAGWDPATGFGSPNYACLSTRV